MLQPGLAVHCTLNRISSFRCQILPLQQRQESSSLVKQLTSWWLNVTTTSRCTTYGERETTFTDRGDAITELSGAHAPCCYEHWLPFSVALPPQKPCGLLGTGSPGWPPHLSKAPTATSTFAQLLSSLHQHWQRLASQVHAWLCKWAEVLLHFLNNNTPTSWGISTTITKKKEKSCFARFGR